jgi:hypothetical protein
MTKPKPKSRSANASPAPAARRARAYQRTGRAHEWGYGDRCNNPQKPTPTHLGLAPTAKPGRIMPLG